MTTAALKKENDRVRAIINVKQSIEARETFQCPAMMIVCSQRTGRQSRGPGSGVHFEETQLQK